MVVGKAGDEAISLRYGKDAQRRSTAIAAARRANGSFKTASKVLESRRREIGAGFFYRRLKIGRQTIAERRWLKAKTIVAFAFSIVCLGGIHDA